MACPGMRLLCLWGPASRELINFCYPELQELYEHECYRASLPCDSLEWAVLHDWPEGFRLAWVYGAAQEELQRAAESSVLLTALIEVKADASNLDAAAAQLQQVCGPEALAACTLRTLSSDSIHSKASAARHLRKQLLKLLLPPSLGHTSHRAFSCGALTVSSGSTAVGGPPALWAIHLEGWTLEADLASTNAAAQGCPSEAAAAPATHPSRVLLGLELARGGVRLAERHAPHAAVRAVRGPTQMRPQLAQATAHLAGLPQGAVVLDPFCGSGALLEAATACGACFCIGSDLGLESSGNSGWDLLAANAGRLSLRRGCLDAIICDIPYGYRALAVVSVPAAAGRGGCVGDNREAIAAEPEAGGGPSSWEPCGVKPATAAAAVAEPADAASEAAEQAEQAQQGGSAPAWRQLLGSLMDLGGYTLAQGGRLLAWLPHEPGLRCRSSGDSSGDFCSPRPATTAQRGGHHLSINPASGADGSAGPVVGGGGSITALQGGSEGGAGACLGPLWLAELGAGQGLSLKYYLSETRKAGFPRAVVVFQKGSRVGAAGSATAGAAGGLLQRQCQAEKQQQQQQGHSWQGVKQAQGGCKGLLGSSASGQPSGAASEQANAQRQLVGGPAALRRDAQYSEVRSVLKGRDIDVWRASWLGDTVAVRSYLEACGDPNALDAKGQTALQFAAGYNKAVVVQVLLEGGADCSLAQDKGRMAPLHRAAARGHATVATLLLEHRANPRQCSAVGQTPCHYAAQFGHRAAVGVLLQPGWHVAAAAEQQAAAGCLVAGPGKQAEGILSAEDDPLAGLRAYVALPDGGGLNALHLAAQWGMVEVAEDLMLGTQPLRLDQSSHCGDPALSASAAPPPLLLTDPNCRTANAEGLTPAHLAARWGHVGVLRALQRLGADLQLRCGGRGRTPLQEAQEWGRPACIEFLAGL